MSAKLVIGSKNYSSWSMRAWLMARKTPLEFVEEKLPLDTPEFEERIGELSPSRTVPALHMDGEIIWDSLAIGEYLAERYPEAGLWPANVSDRAFARSVCAEMHSSFAALRREMPMNCRARGRRVEASAQTLKDIERIKGIWRDCRARRKSDRGGLLGRFGMVDAMYAPVVMRFLTYGVELGESNQAYLDWCLGDVDVAAWVEEACGESEVVEREERGADSRSMENLTDSDYEVGAEAST